jgi:hypothetical protein
MVLTCAELKRYCADYIYGNLEAELAEGTTQNPKGQLGSDHQNGNFCYESEVLGGRDSTQCWKKGAAGPQVKAQKLIRK